MSASRLRRTLQIMAFAMKKLILVIALGLTLAGAPAFAYDYRYDNRATYVVIGTVTTRGVCAAKSTACVTNCIRSKCDYMSATAITIAGINRE